MTEEGEVWVEPMEWEGPAGVAEDVVLLRAQLGP